SHRLLFDTLYDFSLSGSRCVIQSCGGENELHVILNFGLEAGITDCRVVRVFLPRGPVAWDLADGKRVTFRPFLVVLQRVEQERYSAWLPYWHIVEGNAATQKKYGQWAPFMDDPQIWGPRDASS